MNRRWYRLCALVILLGTGVCVQGSEIGNYFAAYRQNGVSDYRVESKIVATYSLDKLLSELAPFYTDTLPVIRQKAFYLTYKKGMENATGKQAAASRLVQGISDTDGSTVGLVVGYLQSFAPADFDEAAQTAITNRRKNNKIPYYTELALLAGFVGIAKEVLFQRYMAPELPVKDKWYTALALARMDQQEPLDYLLGKVRKLPVDNAMAGYIVPDLLYTRQKTAIDFCVKLLYSNEKGCYSANPDRDEKINCAYPVLEKLAAVIVDFPVKTDATGTLESTDYPKMLQLARDWFSKHPDYKIRTDTF